MVAAPAVEAAMHEVERRFAVRATFAEITAAIDACEAMADASPQYLPGIQSYRVTVLTEFGRPDHEVAAALERLAELDESISDHAIKVIGTCRRRPALAARFLPPLVKRLEAAIAAGHDEPLKEDLALARQVCQMINVPV